MVTYTTFGINMLPNVKWSTSFWYIYFQFVEDHLRRQLGGVKRSFMNNTNKTGTIKHLRNKTFECGFKGGEAIRSVEAGTTSYSSTGNRWKNQTLKPDRDRKIRSTVLWMIPSSSSVDLGKSDSHIRWRLFRFIRLSYRMIPTLIGLSTFPHPLKDIWDIWDLLSLSLENCPWISYTSPFFLVLKVEWF